MSPRTFVPCSSSAATASASSTSAAVRGSSLRSERPQGLPRWALGIGLGLGLGLMGLSGPSAAAGEVPSHDGFVAQGDQLFYVGLPTPARLGDAAPKSRAQVQAELQTARAQPLLQDGWRQDGDSLRYVGVYPASASGKSRMSVLDELRAWRAHPVHADGWVSVGDGVFFHGVADRYLITAMPATPAQP